MRESAAVSSVVCQVVGYDVNDYLDSVGIGCFAELLKIVGAAKIGCALLRDVKIERLVHFPPFVAHCVVACAVVLGLLYGRGLYRRIACLSYIRKVSLDVVVSPVEAVQDVAAPYCVLCVLTSCGFARRSRRAVRYACRGRRYSADGKA